MINKHFVLNLRRKFGPESVDWRLTALRQEPLLWDSLITTPLGERALSSLPDRAEQAHIEEDWSPAVLGLLLLNYPVPLSNLKDVDWVALEPESRILANTAYEVWSSSIENNVMDNKPLESLEDASWIALALRERYVYYGGWEFLKDLFGKSIKSSRSNKSVTACLVDMAPDPNELLLALLMVDAELGTHAFLCRPAPIEEQAETFSKLINLLPETQRIQAIMALSHCRPGLAARLSNQIFDGLMDLPIEYASIADAGSQQDVFQPTVETAEINRIAIYTNLIKQFVQKASALRAGRRPEPAIQLYQQAQQVSRSLQGFLTSQTALTFAALPGEEGSGASLQGWEQAIQLDPGEMDYTAKYCWALINEGRFTDAKIAFQTRDLQDEKTTGRTFLYWGAAARLATNESQFEQARSFLQRAIESLQPGQQEITDLLTIAGLALTLGDLDAAERLAGVILELIPTHPATLALQSQIQLAKNQLALALVNASLAFIFQPGEEMHHLIIRTLEANHEWSAALEEHKSLISGLNPPTPMDWLEIARCALRAGQPEAAIAFTQEALTINPQDGLAVELLGEIALSDGDPESSIGYFQRAVQLSPEQVSPWLNLAGSYRSLGQMTRSLETLRQASQALPDSAEVQLALGKTLIEDNSPSLALIPLRQAFNLITSDYQPKTVQYEWNPLFENKAAEKTRRAIVLSLGNTLRQLGFLEESRDVFERVCLAEGCTNAKDERPIIDQELSYNYAQTLLALDEADIALPWLEYVASSSKNPSVDLDYARAILRSSPDLAQIENAIKLLETVLACKEVDRADSGDPTNLLLGEIDYAEASALLAESLQATGNLPRALQAYRQALDSNLVQQQKWRYRLSFGLGQVAIALGYHETAIASFLEASRENPSDPFLFQELSEAYNAIDLPSDAYKTACEAVRLDNANPEMLVWFAKLCRQLSNRPSGKGLPVQEAAMNALESAIRIAPERGDLLIELATIQSFSGDRAGVVATLDQLSNQTASEMIVTIPDLQQAAELLCNIGESSHATELLLQAIRISKIVSTEIPSQVNRLQASLYYELAGAYQMSGDLAGGLSAVDQAHRLDPENRENYLKKANILLEIGDLASATASLEQLIGMDSDTWEIRIQLGLLEHALGNLNPAIEHIDIALDRLVLDDEADHLVKSGGSGTVEQTFTHWLAAQLAHELLQDQRARSYLEGDSPPESFFETYCLSAEIALNQSDVESAAIAIANVIETWPHHPHLLALQSRLVARQEGISETSLQLLRSAIDYSGDHEQPGSSQPGQNDPVISELLAKLDYCRNLHALHEPFYIQQIQNLYQAAIVKGLAEAAVEQKQWHNADILSQKLCGLESESPAAYLLRARTIVLQAEMERLCRALRIHKHAPGAHSLSEEVHQAFESALLNAADRINLENEDAVQQVTRWRVRGKAIFSPDQDSNAAILSFCEEAVHKAILTVEDLAALIWSLSQTGQFETAQRWSQRMPNDSLVSATLALSLSEQDPEHAIFIAQQSLERLVNPDLYMPDARPMLSALIAMLAHKSGSQLEKQQLALASINGALEIWPDEANWHVLAAEILLPMTLQEQPEIQNQPNAEDIVREHLELAARLEPGFSEHHLRLGKWYANHGSIDLAIAELETATLAEPALIEPWLALAGLQKKAGALEKAVYSADRALEFTNQPLDALLLRCELAFLTNNPRGTLSRAQAILNLNPKQPQAWLLMAKAQEALEQPAEALASIEKAISLTAEPLEMQHVRVRLLHSLYGPQTAIQAIQSLLDLYPDEPQLNTLLADYWFELGDPANAIQAARLALQTGQLSLASTTQSHLHLLIGTQSRLAGQLDQSVFHLNEALLKDPENLDAYLELGRTHQDRRQNNQALEIYQMAAKVAPHDYRPYFQSGLALKDIKDYLEAETMFRRAARLAPNEVSIHRQLAAVVALNLVHNRRQATTAAQDRID